MMKRPRLSNNKKFILHILFTALVIYGIAVIPCIAVSFICHEEITRIPLIAVSFFSIIIGATGFRQINSSITQVRPRICYMTTLFTWLFLICITVVPFYYGTPGFYAVNAILASTSAWTTTGICVYEAGTLPASLLLLRSICNWLGGTGIILVTLSMMSSRKFIGWNLASTEFPGPTFLKSEPPFRTAYRRIVMIYGVFTLVELLLLLAAGMDIFTAVLTALSGISTAGMQHINGGIVTGLSASVRIIITVFAFLGSVNGSVFMLAARRRFKDITRDSELAFYVSRIIITVFLITAILDVASARSSFPAILGGVTMQVISFVSTSGYIISDCGSWPHICMIIILLQMFIGSCSLSTGGGIKNARIIIAFKSVSHSLYSYIHPSSVRTLTLNKKPMKSGYVMRANLFIALFLITYLLGVLLLSFDCVSIADALNYSQAMITNTGSFIGETDPAGLAENFSSFGKLSMCFLMIAGRLEIYPLLMIFFRNFWKSDASV